MNLQVKPNNTSRTINIIKARVILSNARVLLNDTVNKYEYINPGLKNELFRELNQIIETFSAKYGLSTLQTAHLFNMLTCNLIDVC
jgi:hypothetical protein